MFIYWFTKLSLKKKIFTTSLQIALILKPGTLWLFLVTHPLLPAVCLINCVDFSIFETIKIQNGTRQEFVFQCLWNSIRIIRNVIYLFLHHTILSKCMFWEWDNRKCFKNSWNFGEIKWFNFTDFSFSKKFLDYTVLWIFEFSKIFFLHVNLLWKQCIKV